MDPDADARAGTHLDPNTDPAASSHLHAEAHADADLDAGADRDLHPHAEAHADADLDANAGADRDLHPHADLDAKRRSRPPPPRRVQELLFQAVLGHASSLRPARDGTNALPKWMSEEIRFFVYGSPADTTFVATVRQNVSSALYVLAPLLGLSVREAPTYGEANLVVIAYDGPGYDCGSYAGEVAGCAALLPAWAGTSYVAEVTIYKGWTLRVKVGRPSTRKSYTS